MVAARGPHFFTCRLGGTNICSRYDDPRRRTGTRRQASKRHDPGPSITAHEVVAHPAVVSP